MDDQTFEYAAFVSYRHTEPDKTWAKWLVDTLETYKIPKALRERGYPSKIGKLYRDEDEAHAGAVLGDHIATALDQSRALIIVCTPNTQDSPWIEREIEYFRSLGRGDRIFCLLADGNPETSFPKSLLQQTKDRADALAGPSAQQSVAADVRELNQTKSKVLRRRARLRLISGLLDCQYDELAERDAVRSRQFLLLLSVAGILGTLIFVAISWFAILQREDARSNLRKTAIEQARLLAREAEFLSDEHRYREAITVALEAQSLSSVIGNNSTDTIAEIRIALIQAISNITEIASFHADELKVRALAVSSSRGLVATLGRRGDLKLWNLESDKPISELSSELINAASITFSSDGRLLAIGTFDGRVQIRDVDTMSLVDQHSSHAGAVYAVAFFKNDKMILSGSHDQTARLWNLETNSLEVFSGHADKVLDVAIFPDGTRVATASKDGTAIIWDVERGGIVHKLVGHRKGISALDISPKGKWLVTGSFDQTARLWNAETGELKFVYGSHNRDITSTRFFPDRTAVATGSYENSVHIWASPESEPQHRLVGHSAFITGIEFLGVGSEVNVVTSSDSGHVKIWNIDANVRDLAREVRSRYWVQTVYNASSGIVAGRTVDSRIFVLHARPNSTIELDGEGSSTISLSFNQDKLLIGNQSGEISFHDIDTLELLDRHQISSDPVESIQEYEPNRLIAVFNSGAFGFYEKRNDELSFEWGNLSGELSSYAISNQHGLIALGTRSGQLEIVDIDSRSNVQKLKIGSDEITSIDFSPDGTMIAAATDRLRVYIWDVKSGNKIQEFGQFDWFISKIKFSPSGQQLAIASGYNELNLWDISSNTVFSDYSHNLVTVDDISFSMKPGFLTSIHPGAIRHSPYFLSDEAMFNSAAAVIAKFASVTPPDR